LSSGNFAQNPPFIFPIFCATLPLAFLLAMCYNTIVPKGATPKLSLEKKFEKTKKVLDK
jgi:hypothetical protein